MLLPPDAVSHLHVDPPVDRRRLGGWDDAQDSTSRRENHHQAKPRNTTR